MLQALIKNENILYDVIMECIDINNIPSFNPSDPTYIICNVPNNTNGIIKMKVGNVISTNTLSFMILLQLKK